MTTATVPTAADVLVELHQRGVEVYIRGDRFGLRPKGKAPDWLKDVMGQLRAELTDFLSDPRRRWKEQAEASLTTVNDPDLREDLRHIFDEREAIASVDGQLGDHEAGRLAYEQLAAAVAALPGEEVLPPRTRT
jgi:predicted transcriptional regulator